MEKKCSAAHIPNAQMSIVGGAQMQKNIGLDMWTRAISMIAATAQNHLARHQIVFATKDSFMSLQRRPESRYIANTKTGKNQMKIGIKCKEKSTITRIKKTTWFILFSWR